MSELTNISLERIDNGDGITSQPCVKSGFCCTLAPCDFGEWDSKKSACKYLQTPNEIGQRDCGRFEYIMANAPNPFLYPAFGAGCFSPIGNDARKKIIATIKEKFNK